MENKTKAAGGGSITIGSIIAVLMSWHINHSILWAFIHFFFSWVYIVYALIMHSDKF
jgi:hypothetical protein